MKALLEQADFLLCCSMLPFQQKLHLELMYKHRGTDAATRWPLLEFYYLSNFFVFSQSCQRTQAKLTCSTFFYLGPYILMPLWALRLMMNTPLKYL